MIKNILARKILKKLLSDASTWILIASNAIVIFYAVKEQWNISIMLWIYWWQSVIIGIFTIAKILSLGEYSTKGVTFQDKPVEPARSTKFRAAGFFAIHYGFFHFFYALMLLSLMKKVQDIKFVFLTTVLFFTTHLFSFLYNRKEDAKRLQYLGVVMGLPYARILPMHVIVIAGGFLFPMISLFVFLVLKAFADVIMHIVEHEEWYLPKEGKTKSAI